MAKSTFLNLSTERQQEIIDISFREFSLKTYENASLSHIIKALGLAKGSFYRYFSCKKELYSFLVEKSFALKFENKENDNKTKTTDVFSVFKQYFIEKIQFDIENPLMGGFLYQLAHDKDNSEVASIINDVNNKIYFQIFEILNDSKYKKQLREINAELISFQVFHLLLSLYDYISFKFNINISENIISGKPLFEIDSNQIDELIEEVLSLIKNGIHKPKQKVKSKSDKNQQITLDF